MADAPDGQISLTDPDARAMGTSARNSGMIGYNVQTAVDAEKRLVVAHDVTNQVHDRDRLVPMARAAKDSLCRDEMHVLADKGTFGGRQILGCHEAEIATTIPRPETSGNHLKGRYEKADLAYEADADICRCPKGEALPYRDTGLQLRRYWTDEPDGVAIHDRQGAPVHAVGARASGLGGAGKADQEPRVDERSEGAKKHRSLWSVCTSHNAIQVVASNAH